MIKFNDQLLVYIRYALVLSRLYYGNATLAGLPACHNRLQSIINAAARSITAWSPSLAAYNRCSHQFPLAASARAHQVQTGGHCLPISSRHCTSVPIGPASVRRRSAVEMPRPTALVDLQSPRCPPVVTCYSRRSLVYCCRSTTLEQSTCRRPVCPVTHNISS